MGEGGSHEEHAACRDRIAGGRWRTDRRVQLFERRWWQRHHGGRAHHRRGPVRLVGACRADHHDRPRTAGRFRDARRDPCRPRRRALPMPIATRSTPAPATSRTRATPTPSRIPRRRPCGAWRWPPTACPANAKGVHIDPTEWNRNDGFSPGSMIVTYVPGLDLARSRSCADHRHRRVARRRTADRAARRPTPASAGRSTPSSTPGRPADADRALIIHPAEEPARGAPLRRRAARPQRRERRADRAGRACFRAYRDRRSRRSPPRSRTRRPHMERRLRRRSTSAGIDRDDLYLAWDFTVASEPEPRGSHAAHPRRRVRRARRRAPAFTVTAVETTVDDNDRPPRSRARFTVPNYLTGDGSPGSRFHYARRTARCRRAARRRNGERHRDFICNIPRSVTRRRRTTPVTPARGWSIYGHGLLGSNDEVNAGNVRTIRQRAQRSCSARPKWAGFERGRHAQRGRRAAGHLATSRRSPTARSRACSTSCSSPA